MAHPQHKFHQSTHQDDLKRQRQPNQQKKKKNDQKEPIHYKHRQSKSPKLYLNECQQFHHPKQPKEKLHQNRQAQATNHAKEDTQFKYSYPYSRDHEIQGSHEYEQRGDEDTPKKKCLSPSGPHKNGRERFLL